MTKLFVYRRPTFRLSRSLNLIWNRTDERMFCYVETGLRERVLVKWKLDWRYNSLLIRGRIGEESYLNGSWIDETTPCLIEAGLMAKVGLMKELFTKSWIYEIILC